MTAAIVYLGIGLIAGVLSGLFGIGGGIVIVPTLILFCHFTQIAANSTSLAALLLPVGILAVLAYRKEKLIATRAALIIALGLSIGVIGGAISALHLPSSLLKRLYGLFLIYISITYIDFGSLFRRKSSHLEIEQTEPMSEKQSPFVHFLLLGVAAGVMAGLFGIGGGIIIVPALISIFKYRYKTAVGTSLMALLLPVGLPGVLIYYRTGQLEIGTALLIGLGLSFGAMLGALIAIEMPTKLIKRIYGLFILLVGLNFIFQFPVINY